MSQNERFHSQSGVTLIEMLIGMGLLLFVGMAVMQAIKSMNQGLDTMRAQYNAESEIDELLDRIKRSFIQRAKGAAAVNLRWCIADPAKPACAVDVTQRGGGVHTYEVECVPKDAATASIDFTNVGADCLGPAGCGSSRMPIIRAKIPLGADMTFPRQKSGGTLHRPLAMSICLVESATQAQLVLETAVIHPTGSVNPPLKRVLTLPMADPGTKNVEIIK